MALSANAMITLAEVGLYTGGSVPGGAAPTTTQLESYIETASDYIRNYCDRDFMKQAYAEYYRAGGQRLTLNHYPVVSISSITVDGVAISSDDYTLIDAKNGIVEFDYYIEDDDLAEVYVSYTAGYSISPGTGDYGLPQDLKYACVVKINELISKASGRYRAEAEGQNIVNEILDRYKNYE